MTFHSLYAHGFARVAACTGDVFIADPLRNADSIVAVGRRCSEQGVAVALFPELSLTGYAIDDLLGQDAVLDAVHDGLARMIEASADLLPVLIVGAPLRHRARLFNTAVVIHRGEVLGVVPKLHLPNYREFYERRQFASGHGITGLEITVARPTGAVRHRSAFSTRRDVAGPDHRSRNLRGHVHAGAAVQRAGAGGRDGAGEPVRQPDHHRPGRHPQPAVPVQSLRCLAAYLYAAAGQGESTTDLSWDGQTSIFENGTLLGQGARFAEDPQLTIADIDLDLLRQERARQGTFEDNRRLAAGVVRATARSNSS